MNTNQLRELLLQSLEHERGGVKVYRTALKCALREDLQDEWRRYLAQTEHHVEVLTQICVRLQIDPAMQTPGCQIVKDMGAALVVGMESALATGNPRVAQLVACECVTLAETKDHADWELIGEVAHALDNDAAEFVAETYREVEEQEDEHLYRSKGWLRELWLDSLGLESALPPPEETQHATSAVEADQAKKSAHRSSH
jgi:rubrerythrin